MDGILGVLAYPRWARPVAEAYSISFLVRNMHITKAQVPRGVIRTYMMYDIWLLRLQAVNFAVHSLSSLDTTIFVSYIRPFT